VDEWKLAEASALFLRYPKAGSRAFCDGKPIPIDRDFIKESLRSGRESKFSYDLLKLYEEFLQGRKQFTT
jgi:hypothetical protein